MSTNRKQRRREAVAKRRGHQVKIPLRVPTDLMQREEMTRRLLMITLDAVGGSIVLPETSVKRVATEPLRLTIEPHAGGFVLTLSANESAVELVQEQPAPAPA